MPATSPATSPAVVVPIYKTTLTPAERVSIDRTAEVLAAREVFLVGPARLQAHLQALAAGYGPRVRHRTFDDRYFASIGGYNRLMRSRVFYQAFADFSHVLICQTDALVLSDQLDRWCASPWAYIGAPWFEGGSQPVQPLRFDGVGNGGFSLRRVQDCLRVLAGLRRVPNFIKSRAGRPTGLRRLVRRIKHEWILAYTVEPLFPSSNEDAFWGVLVPAACPFFRVPSPEEALAFAFEVAPRHLYELNGRQLPFGCHAWERCDEAFWRERLPFLQAAA
ncbi:MAG: hypothetical protein RLZZ451_1597 [Pseudomonadota bacterium]